MRCISRLKFLRFYDNSILPGTKMDGQERKPSFGFYDNSILPGTKMSNQPFNLKF